MRAGRENRDEGGQMSEGPPITGGPSHVDDQITDQTIFGIGVVRLVVRFTCTRPAPECTSTFLSAMEKLYGAAVFFILFLLWLYLLMLCFVVGVVFNCWLWEQDAGAQIVHKKF